MVFEGGLEYCEERMGCTCSRESTTLFQVCSRGCEDPEGTSLNLGTWEFCSHQLNI